MITAEAGRIAAAYVLERYRNLAGAGRTGGEAGDGAGDGGQGRSVALFGAGSFARGLLGLLRDAGHPLPAVIIDEAKGQRSLTGFPNIPILGIAEAGVAGWARPDRTVIIAINQPKLSVAIEDKLRAAGLSARCLIPRELCPLLGWEEALGTAEAAQTQPEILIFHHVPKCGGTSFTSLLRNYFGNNFIEINSAADWRTCERFVRDRAHAKRICAAGHDALGVHELAQGRKVRYVTLLRSPWQRFISAINFRVGYGAHVDRIEIPRNNLVANFSEHRSLAEAKETLDRWFESVGLLERYDDSIRLFAHQLQLPPRFEHSNKSRDWRTSTLTDLRPRFDEKNQDDLAFYEYARARFERDFAAYPGPVNQQTDNAAPLEVIFQREPDGLADEMKVARQSGDPADLIRAHHAFFSRLPYGEVPCAIALEHCRLMRSAGRPDLAVFWHHGAVQPAVRSVEYALSLAALDPYTAAALSLHVELVRLGHRGQNHLAVTVARTRKQWQTELQRHLLRAHLLRQLQDPLVANAPAIFARLDEPFTEALREVATRLGLSDRLHLGSAAMGKIGAGKREGAVVLVHAHVHALPGAGPELFADVRTIAVDPVPEPDWPHYTEFSRRESEPSASAPAEIHPSAKRA
jgi:hypothetical protein